MSNPPLELRIVSAPHRNRGFLAELCATEHELLAVGGAGGDVLVMASSDGEHFHSRAKAGRGLRDVCLAGGQVVAVGEYGTIVRSADAGASWRPIEAGVSGCWFSVIARRDGSVWCCGDDGQLGKVTLQGDAAEFQRQAVDLKGRLSALRELDGELWILGYDGGLYRLDGERAVEVFRGSAALTDLAVTPSGAWIVSGDAGQLYRGEKGGAELEELALDVEEALEAVAVLADGRVVAVGGGATLLVSDDDGRSFVAVKTKQAGVASDATLWTVCRFGRGALIGGDSGLVLQLAPAGDAPWAGRPDRFATVMPLDAVMAAGPEGFLGARLRAYVVAVNPALAGEQAAEAAAASAAPVASATSVASAAEAEAHPDAEADAGADADADEPASVETWKPAALRYCRSLWTGDSSDFAEIWGLDAPPELVAFEQATKGANLYSTFHELRLDVAQMSAPGPDKNLFEMLVLNDQLNYLGTGLPEAFSGVACFGQLGNGDTFHLEVAKEHEDRGRSVVFWNHETHGFEYTFAGSLEPVVYLAALSRAADEELVSEQVAARGYQLLRGKVAPSWHFSMDERDADFVAYAHPGEAELPRWLAARAAWLVGLFRSDGVTELKDLAELFLPNLNTVIPPEQLPRRLETAARRVPTALYAMWRAYLFDEPELEQYLAIGRAHAGRLARDAARLIDELRGGRKQLGKIADWPRLLKRFRALDLDPRRAEDRQREAAGQRRHEQAQKEALAAELRALIEKQDAAGVEAFCWGNLSERAARPLLFGVLLGQASRKLARGAIQFLVDQGYSRDNSIYRDEEHAACLAAAEQADAALQALLIGEALMPAPRDGAERDDGDDEREPGGEVEAAASPEIALSSHHASHIVTRLARLGRLDARALPILRAELELEAFEDHAEWRVKQVAQVLGLARDAAAAPALCALLAKIPAEGEFDTALKYDELIGELADALRAIGEPSAVDALLRFANAQSPRMREARARAALAIAYLAPERGGAALLGGMIQLMTGINDSEENVVQLWAYGLVASAQSADEQAARKAQLLATAPMAASYVEVQMARAAALRLLGVTGAVQMPGRSDAPATLEELMARALHEPGWKEEYTVRRRKQAAMIFERLPVVEAAQLAPALALGDEELGHQVLRICRAHGVAVEPPRSLSWFEAIEASEDELVAMLGDEQLRGRAHAARALGLRMSDKGRQAIEGAARAVARRAPEQPVELTGGDDRLLTESVRALLRADMTPTTLELLGELLKHKNRWVKWPVLKGPLPDDDSLVEAMKQVAAEKWGWQESTARAWLDRRGE